MPLNHNIGGPAAPRHTSPTPFTPFSDTLSREIGPSSWPTLTFEQSNIFTYSEAVLGNTFISWSRDFPTRVGTHPFTASGETLHTRPLGRVAQRKPGMVITAS